MQHPLCHLSPAARSCNAWRMPFIRLQRPSPSRRLLYSVTYVEEQNRCRIRRIVLIQLANRARGSPAFQDTPSEPLNALSSKSMPTLPSPLLSCFRHGQVRSPLAGDWAPPRPHLVSRAQSQPSSARRDPAILYSSRQDAAATNRLASAPVPSAGGARALPAAQVSVSVQPKRTHRYRRSRSTARASGPGGRPE